MTFLEQLAMFGLCVATILLALADLSLFMCIKELEIQIRKLKIQFLESEIKNSQERIRNLNKSPIQDTIEEYDGFNIVTTFQNFNASTGRVDKNNQAIKDLDKVFISSKQTNARTLCVVFYRNHMLYYISVQRFLELLEDVQKIGNTGFIKFRFFIEDGNLKSILTHYDPQAEEIELVEHFRDCKNWKRNKEEGVKNGKRQNEIS